VSAEYRRRLFRAGAVAKPGQAALSAEAARRVVEEQKGQLPLAEWLGCRLRFLSFGVALGSRAFVEEQLRHWWGKPGRKEAQAAAATGGKAETAQAEWFVCRRGRAVPIEASG
jgi:hypothetical protein